MIPDGANGTELERLGARMDQDLWCARALADCPDLVHEVHRRYIDAGTDVIMMHSVRDVTEDAVKVMRANWSGPVGAYPNAGYWTRPNRAFVDQVSPDEYLADAGRWVEAGAAIVGGCCGVGVEHIRALAEGLEGFANRM